MIPTFRTAIEDYVWATVYSRHLSGGETEAWSHADAAIERLRDEAQRRAMPADDGLSWAVSDLRLPCAAEEATRYG